MSFGWSAGDIATALTVAYNLIQALDKVDGAAGNYREAVSFLQHLKRTLEPLQMFTAWSAYPDYGAEITEQVGYIKEPVEQFLAKVLKFEPGLGNKARGGSHRHVLRKLQWHIFMSKKVAALEKKIGAHMRVIDSLMQRLTMDMVWTTQQALPDALRTAFQETLKPEMIAILRENLPPLSSTLIENDRGRACRGRETLVMTSLEDYREAAAAIEGMKLQINSSETMLRNIESSLRGTYSKSRPTALLRLDPPCVPEETTGSPYLDSDSLPGVNVVRESLGEIYYLVFLYLGCFLKNLFLTMSRMVQPPRALMPTLLAQYNISFLDAIGRPPRVLPYEYFRNFKVLQAFIQDDFKSLPGATWVDEGKYLIVSLANNRALNEQNWNRTIAPGAKIAMSMIVRKRPRSLKPNTERCPEPSCSGTWVRSKTESWATCPVCQKEILNAVFDITQDITLHNIKKIPSSSNSSDRGLLPSVSTSLPSSAIKPELAVDDDISLFKRIVQEQDARKLDRGITIQPLPKCPRTAFSSGDNDWFTMLNAPSFDICPTCFDAVIADTEYRRYFIPAPQRALGVEVRCDFGYSLWFRIAWILTLKEGKHDMRMFEELAHVDVSSVPCSRKKKALRQWHSVIDSSLGQPIQGFNACYSCVKNIEVLLPNLKGVFIKTTSYSAFPRRLCSLRVDSKRFVPYFDALETMSDRAAFHDAEPLDTQEFTQLAWKFSIMDECPQDTELADRHWYTITQLPEFTVCEECFDEVVRPEIQEKKALALMIDKTKQKLAAASCQLSSERMRRVFREAADTGDFKLLESTTRERVSLQAVSKLAAANSNLSEADIIKLNEAWKRWNDE